MKRAVSPRLFIVIYLRGGSSHPRRAFRVSSRLTKTGSSVFEHLLFYMIWRGASSHLVSSTRSRPLRSRMRVPPRLYRVSHFDKGIFPFPSRARLFMPRRSEFMWVQQLRPSHAALLVEVLRALERDACSTRQASHRVHLGLRAAQPPPRRSRPLACAH